eukprot:gene48042-58850_t
MELEKVQVNDIDSWKDIEALERETKLLLETVRGKAKPKPKNADKGSSGRENSKAKESKASKKKMGGPMHSASLSMLPLSTANKYTVEVLDDDAPDATPREGLDEDALQREKLKRAQLLKLEQRYRNLSFSEEARRVKSRQDIFVPTEDISLQDVQREERRLDKIQQQARDRQQRRDQDVVLRGADLAQDKATL